ncbi:MAG: triphosphoribosyl-dephospho-CoA synthase [Alloprevotella sp.]|nr:triphosphoribosyl-dephospho-CoA synthase [Alloprevotella sp.]
MFETFDIREVPLSLNSARAKVQTFLSERELRYDEALEYYVGAFDGADNLVAGGGLAKGSIRCLAVSSLAEGEGLAAKIVSRLLSEAAGRGWTNVSLFTKPEHRKLFEGLGFFLLGQADKAILLESDAQAHIAFQDNLRKLARGNRVGAIVMHANPFTLGHLHLCDYVAKRVDTLFVLVLSSETSLFPTAERLDMVRRGVAHLKNVQVIEAGRYAISSDTFPTYFLKELSQASKTEMQLDLDVFANIVAPALNVNVRYVGSEPYDEMTATYNEIMEQVLPEKGIEVEEIERYGYDEPICASYVRALLEEGGFIDCYDLVPRTTWPTLMAFLATDALRKELSLTPKPGLIDQSDNGSHNDMDYSLMQASLSALHPYFLKIAHQGFSASLPTTEELKRIGLEAENAMLRATGGINTHKGALFSLGLMLVAASHSYYINTRSNRTEVRTALSEMAKSLSQVSGTHGAEAIQRFGVRGALLEASSGYEHLFEEWLPYYFKSTSEFPLHRLLLKIISQLDDTNILYRGGIEALDFAKQASSHALELPDECLMAELENLNKRFKEKHISPGGAADMLALTIFAASLGI